MFDVYEFEYEKPNGDTVTYRLMELPAGKYLHNRTDAFGKNGLVQGEKVAQIRYENLRDSLVDDNNEKLFSDWKAVRDGVGSRVFEFLNKKVDEINSLPKDRGDDEGNSDS